MPVFLLPLLNWFASFITGPLLTNAVNAWKAKLDSNGVIDQHTTDLAARELLLEQREAELNAQIQVADEGSWFTRSVRPAFAYLFLAYDAKLIVWDKMLKWGATDPLSDHLTQIEMLVIGFYFGGRTIEKVSSRLTAIIASKRPK